MNPITDGLGAAISGVSSLLKDGIDKIWPNPTDEVAAKVALMKAQTDAAVMQLDAANRAAVAEAGSSDPWTSRARPSFLYVFYIIILTALPMGILSAFSADIAARIAAGMNAWFHAIPDQLWQVFGLCFTVYTGGRTWEKVKGAA